MPQKTSPFLEGKWGWDLGENLWNTGADENWLKFSYMFDRNVDGIVSSLPPAVNGQAYFNTVDNRFYFVVDGTYYSSPCPKWFVFTLRGTGDTYQFNGTAAIQIPTTPALSTEIDNINGQLDTLYSVNGADEIGFKSPLANAIATNIGMIGKEFILVKAMFGAIGDGNVHPLSEKFTTLAEAQLQYSSVPITSLTDSLDWAAWQAALFSLRGKGGIAYGAGDFPINKPLLFPDYVLAGGDGCGYWDTVFPNRIKTWEGTNFLPYGTFAKTVTQRGISSMQNAGGWREDAANPGTYFKLSTMQNTDAVGITPATPKPFSVAAMSENNTGRGWGFINCRLVPWIGTDGKSLYSDQAYTGLADDIDIGVYCKDGEYVYLNNFQCVGYWREYGCLLANPDFDVFGMQERNFIDRCKFQGVNGLAIRSGDRWKVMALSASTVEIMHSNESYWQSSGTFTAFPDSGFTVYSYTSLTRNGANLVFNGVTPDPTLQGITELRSPKRGSGAAGTIITNTQVCGLDHTNGGRSTTYGLRDSTAFEISGFPMRGIQLVNTKIQSRERILMYSHDCYDLLWDRGQLEGSGAIIASPSTTTSAAPAPAGETRNMRGISTLKPDSPYFTPRSRFFDSETINPTGLNSGLILQPPPGGPLVLASENGTGVVNIPSTDRLGVGTTNPAQKIHIADSNAEVARIERTSAGLVGLQFTGTLGTISLRCLASAANTGTFSSSGNGLVSNGTATFQWSDVRSVMGTFTGPVKVGQYTLATLPSAAIYSGYDIDVTDATGGPKRCRSNGSVWQILNTTTTVS